MIAQYAEVLRNPVYPEELIKVGHVYRVQALYEDGATIISERGLPIYFFFDELRFIDNAAKIKKKEEIKND